MESFQRSVGMLDDESQTTQRAIRLNIELSSTNLCQNVFNYQKHLSEVLGNEGSGGDNISDNNDTVQSSKPADGEKTRMKNDNRMLTINKKRFDPEDEYDLDDDFVDDSDMFFGDVNYVPPKEWDFGFFAWHGQIENFFKGDNAVKDITCPQEIVPTKIVPQSKNRRKKNIDNQHGAHETNEKKGTISKLKVSRGNSATEGNGIKKVPEKATINGENATDGENLNVDAIKDTDENVHKKDFNTTVKNGCSNDHHLKQTVKKKRKHPDFTPLADRVKRAKVATSNSEQKKKTPCPKKSASNRSKISQEVQDRVSLLSDKSPTPEATSTITGVPDTPIHECSKSGKLNSSHSLPDIQNLIELSSPLKEECLQKDIESSNTIRITWDNDTQLNSPSQTCEDTHSDLINDNQRGKKVIFYPPDLVAPSEIICSTAAKIYSIKPEEMFESPILESEVQSSKLKVERCMKKLRELHLSESKAYYKVEDLARIQKKLILTIGKHSIRSGMFDANLLGTLRHNSDISFQKLKSLIIDQIAQHLQKMQAQVKNDYLEFETAVKIAMNPQLCEFDKKKLECERRCVSNSKDGNKRAPKFVWSSRLRYVFWKLMNEEWIIAKWYNSLGILNDVEYRYTENGVRKAIYEKVLHYWPEGWMTADQLFRVYGSIIRRIKEVATPPCRNRTSDGLREVQ